MFVYGNICNYDGQSLTIKLDESIDRELMQKQVERVEIRLIDDRKITPEQRKKIFAIINEISIWSGHHPEYIREHMTWEFIESLSIDYFSLSDVEKTISTEFIGYLVDFCFYHAIPTKDTLLNHTDDIGKYLYSCLEYRKCAICNSPADVHHVNKIGMGRDRENIVHIGLEAIALCRKHHELAHKGEKRLFDNFHVYGIKLDEYLCKRLGLGVKND